MAARIRDLPPGDRAKIKAARGATVLLVCNECGKHFRRSPSSISTQCPKCGGMDVEVLA